MKSRLLAMVVMGTLLFASCGNAANDKGSDTDGVTGLPGGAPGVTVAAATEALSDISGTYIGILPCADCEGLKTTLILNSDKTYEIDEEYLGKNVKNKTTGKSWRVNDDILTLDSLNGSRPAKYKIGDNSLVQLDINGHKITGRMAGKYILNKQ